MSLLRNAKSKKTTEKKTATKKVSEKKETKKETLVEKKEIKTLKVGDIVEIISKGNKSKDGDSSVAEGLGLVRYITRIYPDSKFPYQVGNEGCVGEKDTLGFYKKNSLRKK